MLKTSLFLTLCLAVLVYPPIGYGQLPSWQPDRPKTSGYSILYSTDFNFEEVPLSQKLRYVFESNAYYQDHPVLDSAELELMLIAVTTQPSYRHGYDKWQQGCDLYMQQLEVEGELDLTLFYDIYITGEEYFRADFDLHYTAAYELLSPKGKHFVHKKMAALEGTRVMGGGRFDAQRYYKDFSEEIIPLYNKMCDLIPQHVKPNILPSSATHESFGPNPTK